MSQLQIQRILRRPQVIARTGLSRTTIYNLEVADKFPRHWMLTPRVAVWSEAEVEAWLAASRAAPAAPAPSPDVTLRRRTPGRGKSKASIVKHCA